MSWFERRQQAAKLEVEVEPAVVPVLDTAPEQQRRVRKEPRRAAAIPSDDDDYLRVLSRRRCEWAAKGCSAAAFPAAAA
jgi:hypothetical protein